MAKRKTRSHKATAPTETPDNEQNIEETERIDALMANDSTLSLAKATSQARRELRRESNGYYEREDA